MRTSVFICLSFAILAVALAVNDSKKKTPDVEKSSPENKEKDTDTNATPPSEAKKSSKTPAKKTPKASKKDDDDDDLGIEEDLDDLLKDEDDENDEVEIPTLDKITPDTDPIALGEKIKKITDPKKRKELTEKLRTAWKENSRTFPGKFYQAAYASLLNSEKASNFWNNRVKKASKSASNKPNKLMKLGTDSFGGVGLGDVVGNARKLAAIDPVGIAVRRGESVLLNVLSDVTKNFGKLTDMAFDTAENVSTVIKAITPMVDNIPVASEIKKNVHDLFEEGIKRGKYLAGSCADNKSEALARAAKDAAKKADEKEELLRQFTFTSKRKL